MARLKRLLLLFGFPGLSGNIGHNFEDRDGERERQCTQFQKGESGLRPTLRPPRAKWRVQSCKEGHPLMAFQLTAPTSRPYSKVSIFNPFARHAM